MNRDLVGLLRKWRYLDAAKPDSVEFHRTHYQLIDLFCESVRKLDDPFFVMLLRAVCKLRKGKPHDFWLWAFHSAYITLEHNGQKPTPARIKAWLKREYALELSDTT